MDLSLLARAAIPLVSAAIIGATAATGLTTTLVTSAHREAIDGAREFLAQEVRRRTETRLAIGFELGGIGSNGRTFARIADSADAIGDIHIADAAGTIRLSTDPLRIGRPQPPEPSQFHPLATGFGAFAGAVIMVPDEGPTSAVRDATLGRAVPTALLGALTGGALAIGAAIFLVMPARRALSDRNRRAHDFVVRPDASTSTSTSPSPVDHAANSADVTTAAQAIWAELDEIEAEIGRLDPQD